MTCSGRCRRGESLWRHRIAAPCVLCGYAIRRTGNAHVVYGVPAGQAGGCTSSYAILADRDLEGWPQVPEITGGVLAEECLTALRRTRTEPVARYELAPAKGLSSPETSRCGCSLPARGVRYSS